MNVSRGVGSWAPDVASGDTRRREQRESGNVFHHKNQSLVLPNHASAVVAKIVIVGKALIAPMVT
jgi:hypothetical protein